MIASCVLSHAQGTKPPCPEKRVRTRNPESSSGFSSSEKGRLAFKGSKKSPFRVPLQAIIGVSSFNGVTEELLHYSKGYLYH